MIMNAIENCSNMKKRESTSTKYVFETERLTRYHFPTHCCDLVVDRAQASCSEVFITVIRPNHATHWQVHDDTEQIFYILQGNGILTIGDDKKEFPLKAGDVVRVPMKTYHSVRSEGDTDVKYLCVDCFGADRSQVEPTWNDHIRTVCREVGMDFSKVILPGEE